MRHANPKAVTMLLSAFPEMDVAARAILQQTDQILIKTAKKGHAADVRESNIHHVPVVQTPRKRKHGSRGGPKNLPWPEGSSVRENGKWVKL